MDTQGDAPIAGYTEPFQAAVQYGDWKGQARADDIDPKVNAMGSLRHFLGDDALIKPGEFVLGLKVWNGENGHDLLSVLA